MTKFARSEITPDILRSLIDYDPQTGSLIWKTRTPDMFRGQKQDPRHSCRVWNTANAGQPALACLNGNGYLHGAVFGIPMTAHQVAWAIHHGVFPEHGIDHINGDRLDNRAANLRDVPDAENAKNQKINARNTSGVAGVSYFARTGKWVAMIKGDGKVRNLGYFDTLEEAAAAREEAKIRYGFHPNHGRKAA